MSDTKQKTTKLKPFFRILIALLLVGGLTFIALAVYLSTPHAASQVSRLLTTSLHQTVLVSHLELTGTTLRLEKISVDSPGFSGHLAAADAIAIQPQWRSLVTGRRYFRLIEIDGLKLDIRKNSKGVWNFSELQRSMASGKPSGAELYIRQLVVKNGKISINDQAMQNINLQLHNVSSKGTADADVQLAFEDAVKNRYTIAGRARGGSQPALDLTLSAPTFSVNGVAAMLGLKKPPLYGEEPGVLKATAVMQGKLVQTSLLYQFKGMRLIAGSAPLGGALSASAGYDSGKDEVRLEAATLSVNDLIKLHASGRASSLRTERKFAGELSAGEVDLARVTGLLPEGERRTTILTGRLASTVLKVSGDAARGITSASGSLSLLDGLLKRNGRTYASGVEGTLRLAAADKDIRLAGRLHSGKASAESLLQDLDTSFSMALSSKMKPLAAEVSPLSGRAMGIPFTGQFSFRKEAPEPFNVTLNVPRTPLQLLRPFLKQYNLEPDSGTASISLRAAGQGARDLHGAGRVELVSVQGHQEKKAFALKNGVTDFSLGLIKGKLELSGNARFSGVAFGGKGGDAAFAYRLVDDRLALSGSTFQVEGVTGSIERLSAVIPRKAAGEITRLPLVLELAGGKFRRDQLAINGVSATMDGAFIANGGDKWLEGNASLGFADATWQGKPLAASAARLTFARSGASGDLSGTVLGGPLAGKFAFNPFAPGAGSTFQVGVQHAQLTQAAGIVPAAWKAVPTGGLADITCKGSYAPATGPDARLEVHVKNVSINNSTGKTLLSDGGINLRGGISSQKVTVNSAVVSVGEAVAVTIKGAIEQAASPGRTGRLTFALPVTPVNGMVDQVVNVMPRMIQEATFTGTVAGEGALDLQEGRMLLQGAVRLKGVGLDTQQLRLADLSGEIPISLDFSGKNTGRSFDTLSFTRENYPRLLTQLRGKSGAASSVSIGSLAVGPQDLGSIKLQMSAGNGVTRVDLLKASLYGGNIYGKTSFSIDRNLSSRLDLLLDSLSLKELCNAFPKIKGYISGLLDGVISIDASGKKLTDLSGFTELWAREDKREKMLISKEFLQKLSGKKLSGFFFRNDRAYDNAEINAILEHGYLTFERLDIKNTNVFGVKDLSVSIAPSQNRIALDHLLDTIQQAAVRGTRATGGEAPAGEQEGGAPSTPGFQWQE